MSLTKLETGGLFLGCIPIISIPTGIIKFFVYFANEKKQRNLVNQENLQLVAQKLNDAVVWPKEKLEKQLNSDIPNLKWYALAQVIPLVGIFFAIKEGGAIIRLNLLDQADIENIDV